MIFTDVDAFIRFQPPEQSASGDWFVRSVIQDHDGNWWYLVLEATGGNPMVAKIFESYQLTCVDESDAHYKLFAYYTYHGAPELYDIAVPMAVIPESRVMEFI